MTDIFAKLNNLKSKLQDLEVNVSEEVKKEESLKGLKARLDKKLPLVRQMQKSKVIINAGDEIKIATSEATINNFPYKLVLKDELKNLKQGEELFVDASEHLFSAVIDIIRTLSMNPEINEIRSLVVSCHPDALTVFSKEMFLEDSKTVLDKFNFTYVAPWAKIVRIPEKKKEKNIWDASSPILCYSCGAVNTGTHWRKLSNSGRSDDSYCINGYIATCLNCDPNNTISY